MTERILCGNAYDVLKLLPSGYVNMCVTSPPYYGLRDYGVAGQFGIEAHLLNILNILSRFFRG